MISPLCRPWRGVHPGMVEKYIREVGEDVVLAAGPFRDIQAGAQQGSGNAPGD
ncbi:MAG: hypothetical protein ACLTCQ_19280 [Enterocloster bolteae]